MDAHNLSPVVHGFRPLNFSADLGTKLVVREAMMSVLKADREATTFDTGCCCVCAHHLGLSHAFLPYMRNNESGGICPIKSASMRILMRFPGALSVLHMAGLLGSPAFSYQCTAKGPSSPDIRHAARLVLRLILAGPRS